MTSLLIDTIDRQPLRQLQRWIDDAKAAGIKEPNAMALASATADGRPSVRIVLCKGIDDDGITFFTNYASRKGHELDANPYAAAVFHWADLGRQARIEGTITHASTAVSDAYFYSRPRGSQLGAWASPQSQAVGAYDDITASYAAREREFAGKDVPRPAGWGGFVLTATCCEFWLSMPSRLHDRVTCRRRPASLARRKDRSAPPDASGMQWEWTQVGP